MKATSLLVVFIVAKICAVASAGGGVPANVWTPFVYVWQDIVVALAFFVVERVVRKEAVVTAGYCLLAAYAALNVPIARVLSSPLTMPMVRATGGALSDSIFLYATPANFALMGVVLAVAFALSRTWRRRWSPRPALVWVAAVVAMVGAFGSARVDARGLERNPVIAMVRTALPRVRGSAAHSAWRRPIATPETPSGTRPATVLSGLRGVAAGRNVLIVVLESTAAQYLRPYGAAEDPTPNLTRLADSSIVIGDAYAPYPESIKGLVGTLASRYPAFDVSAADHAALIVPSLATVLTANGYETALFHSGRFMYLGMDTVVSAAGFSRVEDAGDIGGNRNSSFGIDETAAVARILRWIDSLPRGKPFFATYLPVAGHHPYAFSTTPPFAIATEVDQYRGALYESDVSLGTLLTGLRTRGLDRNTLVVVLGDHGEAFGQHPGNYGHTLAIYEENVRVPLLFSLPGVAGASGRDSAIASLIDVPPTVLDLLGVTVPPQFEGESLVRATPRMALFFTDYSLGLLGLREGCWKFIHELDSRRNRLFDLCTDPGEANNVADRNEALSARYRERLKAWAAAQVAAAKTGRSLKKDR